MTDANRSALIVASDTYTDPGLRKLRAPEADARALTAVLEDPDIGGFDVRTLLNEPAHEVNQAVEEFFADRRPTDLLLVHFSCHGIKDMHGELYLAASNTRLGRLGSTAVAAEFVNRQMSRSRSRRIVLLLDCCYAGAFERGLMTRAGVEMGIEQQFDGRGRAVITASNAMEYAFEAGEVADSREQSPSVFTSALVEGLRTGDADRNQDGIVGLGELYEYVFDKVRAATPSQTPGKWFFGVEGDLYIARRSQPVTTPVPLLPELQQAIDSPLAWVRAAAVQELTAVLHGGHAGMSLAARLALERLTDDDSRMVAAAAVAALGTRPEKSTTGHGLAREEADRKARADAERRAQEEADRKARAETERRAREEADRKARAKAERRAREESERQAKAKADAERQAQEEAKRQAQEEAERQAQEEAERQAQEEIRAALAIMVEDLVGTSADEVQMDADIRDDLDIDSLSAIELVMEAENRFDIVIPEDEIADLTTVREAVEYIRELQREAGKALFPAPLAMSLSRGRALPGCEALLVARRASRRRPDRREHRGSGVRGGNGLLASGLVRCRRCRWRGRAHRRRSLWRPGGRMGVGHQPGDGERRQAAERDEYHSSGFPGQSATRLAGARPRWDGELVRGHRDASGHRPRADHAREDLVAQPARLAGDVIGASGPPGRILRGQHHHERGHIGRHPGGQRRQQAVPVRDRYLQRRAVERPGPGQALIGHNTEGVQVARRAAR
jgi:acyl carrier protein